MTEKPSHPEKAERAVRQAAELAKPAGQVDPLLQAAVKRLGRKLPIDAPEINEQQQPHLVALQPEQIVAARLRLINNGFESAESIKLDKAHTDYARHRRVLGHLVQIGLRGHRGGRLGPGQEPRTNELLFPGDDGLHKLLNLLEDNRLVGLARQAASFNEIFAPPPA